MVEVIEQIHNYSQSCQQLENRLTQIVSKLYQSHPTQVPQFLQSLPQPQYLTNISNNNINNINKNGNGEDIKISNLPPEKHEDIQQQIQEQSKLRDLPNQPPPSLKPQEETLSLGISNSFIQFLQTDPFIPTTTITTATLTPSINESSINLLTNGNYFSQSFPNDIQQLNSDLQSYCLRYLYS